MAILTTLPQNPNKIAIFQDGQTPVVWPSCQPWPPQRPACCTDSCGTDAVIPIVHGARKRKRPAGQPTSIPALSSTGLLSTLYFLAAQPRATLVLQPPTHNPPPRPSRHGPAGHRNILATRQLGNRSIYRDLRDFETWQSPTTTWQPAKTPRRSTPSGTSRKRRKLNPKHPIPVEARMPKSRQRMEHVSGSGQQASPLQSQP